MALFFYSLLAGLSSILSPCFLPVLFVGMALGTGTIQTRAKWFFGFFTLTFAFVGSALLANGSLLEVDERVWRITGSLVLIGVAVYIWRHSMKNSALASAIGGSMLGIIWTPCGGVVTRTLLSITAAGSYPFATTMLFIAYAIGASIALWLVIFFFDVTIRGYLARHELPKPLNPILIGLLAFVGLEILFGFDATIHAFLLPFGPYSFFSL